MQNPNIERTVGRHDFLENRTGSLSMLTSVFLEIGIVAFLVAMAIAINLRMIRDGVNGLGDLRWHLTWLQHFSKQLSEGIWYPRWLAGTNFGYGSPTFVFYPPLVYYLGSALRAVGLTFEQTVSTLFSGGIFLSGLSFYLFGRYSTGGTLRSRWGRVAAASGALAYMLSPGLLGLVQHGGLSPLYTFVWPPLLLLLTDKAIRKPSYLCGLVVTWVLVALTHLPSLLIYAIAYMLYTLKILWHHPWKTRLQIWLTPLLGWGLAAFFLIPAVLEQRYINIDYMLASQSGFEGYMLNVFETIGRGLDDIVPRQWLACFTFAAIAAVGFAKAPARRRVAGVLLLTAIGIVFLMSHWSWPLWKMNPILQKIEYSSRINRLLYLTEAALCAVAMQSLFPPGWWANVFTLKGFSKKFFRVLLFVVIASILIGNFKYNHDYARRFPGIHSGGRGVIWNRVWLEKIIDTPFSDSLIDVPEYRPRIDSSKAPTFIKEKQSGEGWPAVKETVSGALPTPQPNQPLFEIAEGEAEITIAHWSSYHRRLNINATEQTTTILRIYSYPGWHLYLNDIAHPIHKAFDGRIQFEVEPGQSEIEVVYEKTLAFKLGITASLMSAIAALTLSYHWLKQPSQPTKEIRFGRRQPTTPPE